MPLSANGRCFCLAITMGGLVVMAARSRSSAACSLANWSRSLLLRCQQILSVHHAPPGTKWSRQFAAIRFFCDKSEWRRLLHTSTMMRAITSGFRGRCVGLCRCIVCKRRRHLVLSYLRSSSLHRVNCVRWVVRRWCIHLHQRTPCRVGQCQISGNCLSVSLACTGFDIGTIRNPRREFAVRSKAMVTTYIPRIRSKRRNGGQVLAAVLH